MSLTLFENARVFDGMSEDCPEGVFVLVEDGIIREVSDRPIKTADARRIDVAGRTLMPGLIDLHIHAFASSMDIAVIEAAGEPYNTAHAARMMGHALDCGFTTMRDVGGGNYSLARAVEDGLIRGPRFFYAGKLLSMTGGHGDPRASHVRHDHGPCQCSAMGLFAAIVDGVDACIKAAREELRKGAHCIKIMGSGGVASPADPIWMNQFREDEICAIVNECVERRTYVSAHCHGADAIRRSVEFGVRVIEHGTLIDAETAAFVAERGAYIVPTMAIFFACAHEGDRFGLPPVSQDKVREIFGQAVSGTATMREAGVKIGFGTDLLGGSYDQQCREFTIRSDVFTPIEILRQATSMGAEILMQEGKLGCVAAGAHADLIVVDGNPLKDIGLLAANGRNLPMIMRAGEIVKNEL